MKSIVLCGFMGSGKSTIGKLLALALGFEFIDLDSEIEKKAGRTISEIFLTDGEAVFRSMEYDCAKELAAKDSCVISTGGGYMLSDRNAAVFPKEKFDIVFLDRDFDEIYETVCKDPSRPLSNGKSRSEVKELYDARLPLYKKYSVRTISSREYPEQPEQ